MDIQFFILIYFLITFHPLSTQTLSVTIGDIVAHDHSNINGYNSMFHSKNRDFHYCGFFICIFGLKL